MEIHYLTYRFNSFFLPLLSQDSTERNNNFKKYKLNDIYDLFYLSSGICNLFIKNNSLKLLNKYIIYIKQSQIKNISINFIESIYNFLINYDFENKNHNEILEEINHKIYVYNNLENFKNYINTNPQIINNLLT